MREVLVLKEIVLFGLMVAATSTGVGCGVETKYSSKSENSVLDSTPLIDNASVDMSPNEKALKIKILSEGGGLLKNMEESRIKSIERLNVKPSSEFDRSSLDGADDYNRFAEALLYEGKVSEGINYLELAALHASSSAQQQLADRYESGDGVEVNFKKAYLYNYLVYYQKEPDLYRLAAENPNIEALPKNQKFKVIENRLWPDPSEEDREWLQVEIDRHLQTIRDWVSAREAKRQQEKSLENQK